MDPSLIESMLRFCNTRTIDFDRSPANAIRAIVGMCQRFIDQKALLAAAVPDTYVDWAYVEAAAQARGPLSMSTLVAMDASGSASGAASVAGLLGIPQSRSNPLGGVNAWMDLLEHVSFPSLELQDSTIQGRYPPLWCVLSSIRVSRAYDAFAKAEAPSQPASGVAGEAPFARVVCSKPGLLSLSDVCKLYLAINLEVTWAGHAQGVTSRDFIESFISSRISGHSHHITNNLMTSLADQRNSSETYLETASMLLKSMAVDEESLRKHVSHYREARRSQQSAWAVKYVEASRSRTSMREVAKRVNGGAATLDYGRSARSSVHGSEAASSVQGGGVGRALGSSAGSVSGITQLGLAGTSGAVTFEIFCDMVGFPVSMSRLLRLRCYLLCAQSHIMDHAAYADRLVPRDVAASIASRPISFPNVSCLCSAIESLAMNIPPFAELDEFRRRAFSSFALNHRRGLTLTQILHLYVAAYQKRDIWKSCWKRIYPVMSTQIARDVESFTSTTRFAVEPFMIILKTSTPFIV